MWMGMTEDVTIKLKKRSLIVTTWRKRESGPWRKHGASNIKVTFQKKIPNQLKAQGATLPRLTRTKIYYLYASFPFSAI
jgi:hypothetical protein